MNEQIQYRCDCGTPLQSPISAAGKSGTCRHCGRRVEIPFLATLASPNGNAASTSNDKKSTPNGSEVSGAESSWPPKANSTRKGSDSPPIGVDVRDSSPVKSPIHAPRSQGGHTEGEATPQLCSICQTHIQGADPITRCGECQLPFHVECWEENLGCSAYGCPNVNALRAGPDIQISNPPPLPSGAATIGRNHASDRESEIPWDYVLLAATALGALLGVLLYGICSFLVGVVAFLYVVIVKDGKPSLALAACFAMSLIGFVGGVLVSFKFWW